MSLSTSFLPTFHYRYFDLLIHHISLFISPQGIRKIRISQKLHKLGAKWGYDWWTHMHFALSGTNTQQVIDLLKELFGDPPKETDLEELDLPPLKHRRSAATAAKTSDAVVKQEYDPSKHVRYVHVLDSSTPVDFGIESDLVPKVTDVLVIEADGTESTKVYNRCKVCPHKGQNRASLMNHMRSCLNIMLQCPYCNYSAVSAKAVNGHIIKEHPLTTSAAMELEEIGHAEAEEVMAALAHAQEK